MVEMKGAQWLQWKRHEQTQAFLIRLQQSVSDIQRDWCNNSFVADDQFRTLMLNAGALSAAQTLQQIIDAIDDIQDQPEGESDAQ